MTMTVEDWRRWYESNKDREGGEDEVVVKRTSLMVLLHALEQVEHDA